jgi:diguanylate cyclase (GGDEF)-like protein
MGDDLRIENLTLRRQLEALLTEARQNEDKLRRFDLLERRMIGAASLLELAGLLLDDYRRIFGIERVALALVDPDCEIRHILLDSGMAPERQGLRLLPSDDRLKEIFGTAEQTRLMPYDAALHHEVIGGEGSPASVAMLPLWRQGALIGCIGLCSTDPQRYAAGAGTDFLDRLAAIGAVCIDSALSRERLKRAGITDALTGVHNRRFFEHRCPAEASQARRQRQPLACMFLDADRFKQINDTHGHQAGDRVLREIANTIKAQLRTSDTLARYGGEEFVALLPQTAQAQACDIAERIRAAIAATRLVSPQGQTIPVTISIGIAMLDPEAPANEGEVAMIAAADSALYAAKHGGRNQVACAGAAGSGSVPSRDAHRAAAPFRRLARRIGALLGFGLTRA